MQKWALVEEILGGIAVVLSLIFVGCQLKQKNEETALNTRALELAAYQQLIERNSDFNLVTLEQPELGRVREKLGRGEEVTGDEESIPNAFLYLAYRMGDLAFLQYQRG